MKLDWLLSCLQLKKKKDENIIIIIACYSINIIVIKQTKKVGVKVRGSLHV